MDKKSILSILIVVALCASSAYLYINKDHRNIEKEKAVFSISATEFHREFSNSISESETKYLNKTVQVSGTISGLNASNLTIDEIVFCTFSKPITTSIDTGNNIKIKGRVIGYDDLFEQVKLDQCSIIID